MGAEQRLKLTLGDLIFRIAVLESQVEDLTKKVAEHEAKDKPE